LSVNINNKKQKHMTKINNNSTAIAFISLRTMTQAELRNVAKQAGIVAGKNKTATVENIINAIKSEKIQFKSTFVIAAGNEGLLPNQPIAPNALFQKKFRNYNGFDKVEFAKS